MPSKKVVTRFAPSPTGFMHIGGIRTALFAYLFAKKEGGEFILRIEDTDKAREVEGSLEHIQEALKWLDITWDYGPGVELDERGPWKQSDRLDIYKKYAEQLIEKGLAYPDPYTQEELESFREKAKEEKRPFLFRDHRPETFETWDGAKPLRLKVPEIKRYSWHDEVRGDLEAGEEMLDDIILIKADGYPTYNFAHIVDDHEMGVTHVMRGEEFISSTPKFLSIHDALEIPYPKFVTMPPIMAADGKKKLGKRDGAKDILEYKTDGYLPETMLNFLALIGWNPGGEDEIFSKKELIELFSINKIQKSGGAFNEEKLRWMNKAYLDKLDTTERDAYVAAALPQRDPAILNKLTATILERTHNQVEIREADKAGEYDWAFGDIAYEPELLKWKNDETTAAAKPRLEKVLELLSAADFSSPDTIKEAVWVYAEETGKGEVLWPTRVALSGRERSPDPFTCAYVLGQEKTLKRLKQAVELLS